jgi:hypothetical protein
MAVTANQQLEARNPGHKAGGPVVASKRLYANTMAFVVPATGGLTDVIATTVNKFRGIVVDEVDNSSGALGDKRAEIWQSGEFFFRGQSGFAQTDVGKPVYAVDNYTLSLTATDQPRVGTINTFISATKVGVLIDPQIP